MKQIAAVVFLAAVTLSGQAPDAIPVDQEPNHKLVFANPYVRVIDARFPPGHITLMHTHAADNSAITISTGRDDPESAARVGRVGFSKGGYAHRVTNTGPLEQRFIDVEFLKSDRVGSPGVADSATHKLELENDRVRIYRVKVEPGQSVAPHSHQAGWLGVTVKGGRGPGTNQWFAAGTANALAVKAGEPGLEIVELEPR